MIKRYKVVTYNRSSMTTLDSKFILKYNRNTIVEAVGTLGIFVFDTRRRAESFLTSGRMIITVRPIGRKKEVKKIAAPFEHNLSRFYLKDKSLPLVSPPDGTLIYNKVLVLD